MTKKKRPEDLLPRGRPKKVREPKDPKRVRATSPFLLTAKQRKSLPEESPLRLVLDALPDLPDTLLGELDLADLPVALPCVRMELTVEQIANADSVLSNYRKYDIDPYASNSRRSIRADWRHWVTFCVIEDRVAMPIAFADIKDFFDALMTAGYQRATLEHLLFTLRIASRLWGCPVPTDDLIFQGYWKQAGRIKLKKAQHQAAGLNVEDVEALVESTPGDDPRALRDLAFASVAYDAMARASELISMRWEDITFDSDREGAANFRLGRSKTDQAGEGVDIYLTPETAQRLREWQQHAVSENPYVFHALPRYSSQEPNTTGAMAIREVSRIFERIAKRAGIHKNLSGHSARVGGAQDMTRAGLDIMAIMQTGRWKTTRMPARYVEKELASRAGKNRTVALRKLVEESHRSK